MRNNIKESLVSCVEQLDEENSIRLAKEALDDGIDPIYLLDLMNEGMKRVGILYDCRDYFIADLIMAGLIFRQILELEEMTDFFHRTYDKKSGKIVIGTVKGDIHDIGKDIFRYMLEAYGFDVIDLGVDVSREIFVKNVEKHNPDILALSGVLTSTVDEMKEVVNSMVEAHLRDKVKIIIGANHLTQDAFRFIGADGFATDASVGAKLCREWVNAGNGQGVEGNG
ncbi:B12-binding domain-containing protein [Desulfosporosinus sp. BICA1-9]|uniref:cobalamin B12-binding domain-containing protein n=1 Tax=Desulfosporosinus sp. BICA1-9 TaxID=1531958 RepID=UPI00054C7024|nr:cobalamin-dependent protein [Desulfosporosinus sp. BICA1-9]KJS48402.1 MAG: cobalamin-binding protein [Peptococcaceae bacterium BRH_c23]KJS89413.1 MAG: cobalamin-binding protein [Desulfosporosinus sp. BICA1-9]